MPFESAKSKLTIATLDGPKIEVPAQYNPKELQIDKTVPWTKVNQANKSGQEGETGIHLEFTGAEGRTMSVELLFDGFETGGKTKDGTVAQLVGKLEKMSSVMKPSSKDENERRPPRCQVTWGDGGMPKFNCVIEQVSTKYTMFSTTGVALRATCTVKLKEADVASMAKAK